MKSGILDESAWIVGIGLFRTSASRRLGAALVVAGDDHTSGHATTDEDQETKK